MRNLLIAAVLACLGASSALGQEGERAGGLYQAGRFREAATAYQELAARKPLEPVLHYNLGNALFKAGDLGPAVAAYLRAFRLHPRDSDLQHNLDFALRKAGEELFPDGVPRQLWRTFYVFSLTELEGLAWLAWWALWLLGAAALSWNRRRKAILAGAALAGLACGSFGGWWALRRSLEPRSLGVVARSRAELRNGPGENFSVGFTLPEGRRLAILGSSGDWLEVGVLKEGGRGWLQAASVQMVE